MSPDVASVPLVRLPVFDRPRARRFLEELALVSPLIAGTEPWRGLLESAAGNSPYLVRSMLNEPEFLAQLLEQGFADTLATLRSQALGVAEEAEAAAVMRRLRLAKRRTALAVALADIGGWYGLKEVCEALSSFADASV